MEGGAGTVAGAVVGGTEAEAAAAVGWEVEAEKAWGAARV